MNTDKALREHLVDLLDGGDAHVDFESVIKDFPLEIINLKAENVPYTPWHVLEHMRIAQWDILEFSRDPQHVSPPWPEGYWPASRTEAEASDWHISVEAFRADLEAMKRLVENPSTDLYTPLAHGTGQTLLREALLIADHNAYHLGVLVTLKRILKG